MNSVLLDTSFLISLSSPSRSHHEIAKKYFKRFISAGVPMYLSTIVISEYEVKQRVDDLGLANFIVTPFNYEDAILTAKVFTHIYALRGKDDERVAVKDDSKIIGQCVSGGITHFVTDDKNCAERIDTARRGSYISGLPFVISLHEEFCEGWFSNTNQVPLFIN